MPNESTALQLTPQRAAAIQRQQESADLFRPSSFGEAMEFAKVLADSGMIPKAYAGKPAAPCGVRRGGGAAG